MSSGRLLWFFSMQAITKRPLYTQSWVLSLENICPRSFGAILIFFFHGQAMCPDAWSNTYVHNREAERTEGEVLSQWEVRTLSWSREAQAAPGKCREWFKKHARSRRGYTQEGNIPPPPPLLAPPSSHPMAEDLSSVISPTELSLTFELWKFLQTNYAVSESGTRQ